MKCISRTVIALSILIFYCQTVRSQDFEVHYKQHPNSTVQNLIPLNDGLIVHVVGKDEAFLYRYDTVGILIGSLELDIEQSHGGMWNGGVVFLQNDMIYHYRCKGDCGITNAGHFELKCYDLQFDLQYELSDLDFPDFPLSNETGCAALTPVNDSTVLFRFGNMMFFVNLFSLAVGEVITVPEGMEGNVMLFSQDSLLLYGMNGVTLYNQGVFTQLTNQTLQNLYSVEGGYVSTGYPNMIRKWDLDFNQISSYQYMGGGSLHWDLIKHSNHFYASVTSSESSVIVQLDEDLNELAVMILPEQLRSLNDKKMIHRNKWYFGYLSGSLGYSAAVKEVALDLTYDDVYNDIGVVDIQLQNVSITGIYYPALLQSIYTVHYDAIITVENFSESEVSSAVLSASLNQDGIHNDCTVFSHYFEIGAISPNGTTVVEVNDFHSGGLWASQLGQNLAVEICFASYAPNALLDDNTSNNIFCAAVPVNSVGINISDNLNADAFYQSSSQEIIVQGTTSGKCDILDMSGRIIHSLNLTNTLHSISMKDYSAGLYIVRLNGDGQLKTIKVLKGN